MAHAMTMNIDTLAVVKKLEASGFQPNQAEGVTEVIRDAFDNLQENVATKQEVNLSENSNKQEFCLIRKDIEKLSEKLTLEFDSKLSKTKSDIIMWIVGLLFAQTAIMVSIIKFIH